MRSFAFIILCLSLSGCNSIYMKPGTLDKSQSIYATRGGFSMRRSVKEILDKRGYNVSVGSLKTESAFDDGDIQTFTVPQKTQYVVYVKERKEFLRPIWCMFNGFWWWNFNLSITNKKTGTEILSWRGRGCANSSLRKLNAILDELEMKTPNVEQKPAQPKKKVAKPNKQNTELLILAK